MVAVATGGLGASMCNGGVAGGTLWSRFVDHAAFAGGGRVLFLGTDGLWQGWGWEEEEACVSAFLSICAKRVVDA